MTFHNLPVKNKSLAKKWLNQNRDSGCQRNFKMCLCAVNITLKTALKHHSNLSYENLENKVLLLLAILNWRGYRRHITTMVVAVP